MKPQNQPHNPFSPAFWTQFVQRSAETTFHSLFQIVLIIAAYLFLRVLIRKTVDGLLNRLMKQENSASGSLERHGRLRTLQGLFKSVAEYVLGFVFGILLFKALGFDIMPFITTAGVVGLAIGFGAQKLVKDVISGFFIIADDLFSVGDYVKIGEVTGRVEEMEMRVTRLQDLNGKVYLFSNGDIGMITNLSRNPVEEFIEIQLAYSADIKAATECINEAGEAMLNFKDSHLKTAPCTIGTSSFNVASISLRVSVSANPRYLNIEMMRVREAIRLALNKDRIPLA